MKSRFEGNILGFIGVNILAAIIIFVNIRNSNSIGYVY